MIENGFVHIPETAPWLTEYLHEMTVFPRGKHDDQVDSTAQFLDWFKKTFPRAGALRILPYEVRGTPTIERDLIVMAPFGDTRHRRRADRPKPLLQHPPG